MTTHQGGTDDPQLQRFLNQRRSRDDSSKVANPRQKSKVATRDWIFMGCMVTCIFVGLGAFMYFRVIRPSQELEKEFGKDLPRILAMAQAADKAAEAKMDADSGNLKLHLREVEIRNELLQKGLTEEQAAQQIIEKLRQEFPDVTAYGEGCIRGKAIVISNRHGGKLSVDHLTHSLAADRKATKHSELKTIVILKFGEAEGPTYSGNAKSTVETCLVSCLDVATKRIAPAGGLRADPKRQTRKLHFALSDSEVTKYLNELPRK